MDLDDRQYFSLIWREVCRSCSWATVGKVGYVSMLLGRPSKGHPEEECLVEEGGGKRLAQRRYFVWIVCLRSGELTCFGGSGPQDVCAQNTWRSVVSLSARVL